jgi:hypothetical protein
VTRSARWLILALTVVVVGGLEEFHAHFVGHYPFFQLPRFAWLCVLVVLVWVTTYAVGIPDDVRTGGDALVRAAIALGVSAGIVSVIALLAGTPLLPRFTVLTTIAFLAPLDAAVSVLARRGQSRESEAERVLAVVGQAEGSLLAAELERSPERRALLVASCTPAEAVRAPGARTLAELVAAQHRYPSRASTRGACAGRSDRRPPTTVAFARERIDISAASPHRAVRSATRSA